MTSVSVIPTDNEIQRSGASDMTALYWARVDGIDPSQEKPIQVTRHWRGHTVQFRCYVTQDLVDAYQARKLSIGDYVLTGGELPALVVIDAVLRLLPGVLGSEDSAQEDSHVNGLLEYPQYTRPADFRGWSVPEVLLSGNHAQIARWRREQIVRRTLERRPDLINRTELGREEKEMVKQVTALNKAKSSLNEEPEK